MNCTDTSLLFAAAGIDLLFLFVCSLLILAVHAICAKCRDIRLTSAAESFQQRYAPVGANII